MRQELENYRQLGKPVHEDFGGTRLDDYLGKHFLFMSRTQWKKAIREPKVLVNEETRKGSYKLREGDVIHYFSPEWDEPEVDSNIKVVWEKDGVIAVYKPSNLPIHEGGAYKNNTFCRFLQELRGPEWAPVHRLDRETSGLVLCAHTSELRNALSESLRTHAMQKTYLAIGVGEASLEKWTVDEPLGSSETSALRTKQAVRADGAASLTEFEVLERKPGFTFMKVKPKTGRTHQIRVHMKYIGHTLFNDERYGGNKILKGTVYSKYKQFVENCFDMLPRQALHAKTLGFIHPKTKENILFDSDIPVDMNSVIEKWRGYSKHKNL